MQFDEKKKQQQHENRNNNTREERVVDIVTCRIIDAMNESRTTLDKRGGNAKEEKKKGDTTKEKKRKDDDDENRVCRGHTVDIVTYNIRMDRIPSVKRYREAETAVKLCTNPKRIAPLRRHARACKDVLFIHRSEGLLSDMTELKISNDQKNIDTVFCFLEVAGESIRDVLMWSIRNDMIPSINPYAADEDSRFTVICWDYRRLHNHATHKGWMGTMSHIECVSPAIGCPRPSCIVATCFYPVVELDEDKRIQTMLTRMPDFTATPIMSVVCQFDHTTHTARVSNAHCLTRFIQRIQRIRRYRHAAIVVTGDFSTSSYTTEGAALVKTLTTTLTDVTPKTDHTGAKCPYSRVGLYRDHLNHPDAMSMGNPDMIFTDMLDKKYLKKTCYYKSKRRPRPSDHLPSIIRIKWPTVKHIAVTVAETALVETTPKRRDNTEHGSPASLPHTTQSADKTTPITRG